MGIVNVNGVAVSRRVGETATASSRTQPGMILSSEALYGKQKGCYMVVQPTVSSCTLVMHSLSTADGTTIAAGVRVHRMDVNLNVIRGKTYDAPPLKTGDHV